MQFLKSLGDGVGTAAGVAWPTFGLMFGALGIAVGGLTAIILGSILASLFLLIAVPITIWSYKNHKRETKKSFENLEKTRKRTGRLVLRYLLGQLNFILFEKKKALSSEADYLSLLVSLKTRINDDLSKSTISEPIKNVLRELLAPKTDINEDLLYQFWLLVCKETIPANHQLVLDLKNPHTKKLRNKIKTVSERNKLLGQSSQVSYLGPVFSGVVGFLAAFGSVAGCAAGLMGLLSSVGFATSLATTPMLGWGILIAAIGFALIVAAFSIKSSWQSSKVHLLINDCEELNEKLDAQIHLNVSELQKAQAEEYVRTNPVTAELATAVPPTPSHKRARTLAAALPSSPLGGSGRSSAVSSDDSSTGSSESDEESRAFLRERAALPSSGARSFLSGLFGSRAVAAGPPVPYAPLTLPKQRSVSFS